MSLRVAVVGLGTGSLACHRAGDEAWRFYEIDPAVARIARDPDKFRFLSACGPDIPVVLGDARLTLAEAPGGENPGGLNRVYANLVSELLHAGVELQGFVVGSADVMHASGGSVASFAPADASLVFRMHALRRAAVEWLRTRPDAVVVSHFAQNAFPMLDQLGEHPFVVHFQGPWGQESRVEGAPPWAVMASLQKARPRPAEW